MIRFRVDDYPGTKPEEFYRHNIENFVKFHEVMRRYMKTYTLGVIPRHTSVEDLRILRSLDVEIALHGIDHDERFPNEFRDHLTTWDIVERIKVAVDRIHYETMSSPRTYIPPHNVIDRKTVDALVLCGFDNLMTGPGTAWDVEKYAQDSGLKIIPSYPPMYGRSDELSTSSIVEMIKRFKIIAPNEIPYLGLHWTWEHNIGLHNLDLFLSELMGRLHATPA